jgi:hypothetical protein
LDHRLGLVSSASVGHRLGLALPVPMSNEREGRYMNDLFIKDIHVILHEVFLCIRKIKKLKKIQKRSEKRNIFR